jgi:NAD(P)H-dependent flavin oxidoreductase YrpB (nitropropane dioxygenase family)
MASEVSAMTLQELFGIELPIIQAPMAAPTRSLAG